MIFLVSQLESFLKANRDEYFRHSALNYTAQQKQYNNWLTDRVLEVAERYNYEFDPEDFNYVRIRDRIRCYYKSYVQTMRKRDQVQKAKEEAMKRRQAEAEQAELEEEAGASLKQEEEGKQEKTVVLAEYKEEGAEKESNSTDSKQGEKESSADSKEEA